MSGLFDDHVTRGSYPCPWCGEQNDAAIGPEPGNSPKPGDVTVCMRCARPSIYQEVGSPRKPTETEWKSFNDDEDMTALRKSIFMSTKGNVQYRNFDISVVGDGGEDRPTP